MNRAARRKLRRSAADLAREYVQTGGGIVVAGLGGGVARIDHPTARRIVRQELFQVLRDTGRPRVRRLSTEESAAFPFMRQAPDGADGWLATGIDRDGRATVVTRWLPVVARGDGEGAHVVRMALLAELAAEQRQSGIPMPKVMEGRA